MCNCYCPHCGQLKNNAAPYMQGNYPKPYYPGGYPYFWNAGLGGAGQNTTLNAAAAAPGLTNQLMGQSTTGGLGG